MKVMVLGATGMLGHKLVQHFSSKCDTVGTVRQLLKDKTAQYCFNNAKIVEGITSDDIAGIQRLLDKEKPTALVNAIGIIKHLKESYDPVPSLTVNAVFPHQLANLCRERGIRLIHFSTDCVFDGKKGNYNEKDKPDCDDLYGQSKLMGEVSGKGCFTIRTSIIGRELHRGLSLIEWFLSQRGKEVKGYQGALYTGFTTNTMAEIVTNLLTDYANLEGVWHVSSDPISKYDLLEIVNRVYDLGVRLLPETQFKCDRRLDSQKFRLATNFKPPSWEDMIKKMHADSTPYLLG